MMFGLLVAPQESNEGDGLSEFCAWSDWDQYNELCHSVLPEEAEKSGASQFIQRHLFSSLFQDNLGKLAPERLNQSGF